MKCKDCIHYKVGGMCAMKKAKVKPTDACCPKFKSKPHISK